MEALEFGTLSPSVFLKFELRLPIVSDSGLRLRISCLFFFFFFKLDYSKTFMPFPFKRCQPNSETIGRVQMNT